MTEPTVPPPPDASTPTPRALLARLQPYFERIPNDVPGPLAKLLHQVLDHKEVLGRDERQITFFGAFKAGKSTLLNALVGAPLLPTRANRATGAVTRISYAPRPAASIVRRAEDGQATEDPIPFDDAARHILLDLSGSSAEARADVEEVSLRVPLPFVRNRCVLVDTPGLLDDAALSQRGFREVARSDLVVMVLSADKILSGHERDAARAADDLLNGDVVYVVNRLDMIDQEDREDVLDWARTALQGSGNALVGQPRIFATAAKGHREGAEGIAEFQEWLGTLLDSPAGDRVAALSRLGILERRLKEAAAGIERELTVASVERAQLEAEEAEALERERAELRDGIAADRRRLRTLRAELSGFGEDFVQECVRAAERELKGERDRASPLRVPLQEALERYAGRVFEGARAAVEASRLPIPPFDLQQVIVSAEVSPTANPAGELAARLGSLATRVVDGGEAGRVAGASIGGWIDKNILGVDAARQAMEAVERAARNVASLLEGEAGKYLNRVEALLAEADRYYEQWVRTSSRLSVAQETEGRYRELLTWCTGFLEGVQGIEGEFRP